MSRHLFVSLALATPFWVGCVDKDAEDDDGGTSDNRPPEINGVTLSPDPVTTDGVLTAQVDAEDPDGDDLVRQYAWAVDGVNVQAGADDTLDGAAHFDRGQEVTVTVTVGDGVETATATSAAVAVVNSLPQAPGLELRPDPPEHGAPLTCVVAADAVDADGDAVTYEMSWAVDGAAWTASADSGAADSGAAGTDSTWPGDTVPADVVQEGQEWTCTAVPDDGASPGTPGEVSGTAVCAGFRTYAETPSLVDLRRAGTGQFEDLDGDGDLDMMWAQGPQMRIETFDGAAYTLIWTQPSGMISRTNYQPFDMNGDGYSGVAVSHLDSESLGYSGKALAFDSVGGTVSTSRSWQESSNGWPAGITVGDINNDGYDDVFVHNHPGGSVVRSPSGVYANSGGSIPGSPTRTLSHPTAWGDLGDIDGDGDLELLTCGVHTCGHCPIDVYQQAVIYDFDSGWGLTQVWSSPTVGSGQADNNDHRCEFGDINGDGALDVITAGKWAYAYSSGTTTRGVRVYLNDGAGTLSTSPDQALSATGTTSLVVGDITGDGFDEILFGDNDRVSVYGNDFSPGADTYVDGTSGLVLLTQLPGVSSITDVEDLTGDGVRDLVVSQDGEMRVLTQTCD